MARAQAWLSDAEVLLAPSPDEFRVQEESRAGIRPVRLFLEAVASAAGL